MHNINNSLLQDTEVLLWSLSILEHLSEEKKHQICLDQENTPLFLSSIFLFFVFFLFFFWKIAILKFMNSLIFMNLQKFFEKL